MTKRQITAVLDTNTFLHYTVFDQIDWSSLLNASEVRLLVVPVVLRELDKHKNTHQRQKLRERAAFIIKKLKDLFEQAEHSAIRSNVAISVVLQEPSRSLFDSHNLDVHWQDDWLLASILQFLNENPGNDVVLVSQDSVLPLKAKSHKLRVFSLPDNLRLAEEADLDEKRIKQLEKENLELKSRMPDVSIRFTDHKPFHDYHLTWPKEVSEDSIRQQVEELKKQHPKYPIDPPSQAINQDRPFDIRETLALTPKSFSEPYSAQKEEYNSELEKFYEDYYIYLKQLANAKLASQRMISLIFLVTNTGKIPAEEIDIWLYFPKHLRHCLSRDLAIANTPIAPKPPVKPKPQSIIERIHNDAMLNRRFDFPYLRATTPYTTTPLLAPNVTGPYIVDEETPRVTISIRKLKHNHQWELDPIYLFCQTREQASSFKIDYQITSANVPDIMEGELHVKLDVIETSD